MIPSLHPQPASPACRELGFLPVEVNASDTRNKSDKSALKGVAGKLSNSIRELATNTAIGVGTDGKPKRVGLSLNPTSNFHAAWRGGRQISTILSI